jgi:hypothetical protein
MPPAATRRQDALSAAEISKAIGVSSAAEAIRLLRPEYLRRGADIGVRTSGEPVVYLNMRRIGGLETLDGVRAKDVREVRYIRTIEARHRFGQSVNEAVILVLTW